MANFDTTYRITMRNEGGYTNNKHNPNDKGGETYKGISRRWHPNWPGWVIIDGIKAVREIEWNEQLEIADLKIMVKAFYRNLWKRMMGDQIKDQSIADIMYDFFVMVDDDAIKMAQRIVTDMGKPTAVDGRMGPKTLAAINSVDSEAMFYRYREAREAFHRAVAAADPTQKNNLRSWLNRLAIAFPTYIQKKTLA